MSDRISPIQKILFGSPGTGKSYHIRTIATEQLGIEFDTERKILKNTVKTVFHPEYTYADFMGKLLPLTQGNSVIYKFYPGHFLRSLGMAYRGLIDGNGENYLLAIDELNRGNAAAIFGTMFQLLDRESDGWSSYEVDISEMELIGLLNAMGFKPKVQEGGIIMIENPKKSLDSLDEFCENFNAYLQKKNNQDGLRVINLINNYKIKIPFNFSIVATINTSDESIYYLDSAFKRRWDWQYFEAPSASMQLSEVPTKVQGKFLEVDNRFLEWYVCIIGLNEFIKSHYKTIRKVEDKQIGWWFVTNLRGNRISIQKIKDKLMFYLWDNVFSRDKRPLEKFLMSILKTENLCLPTYASFLSYTVEFTKGMYNYGYQTIENNRNEINESSTESIEGDDIPL